MGKALKQSMQEGADFDAYYGGVKKDGGFLKSLRDKVEKDPLLGEKDRWQTHAKLQQLQRQVMFPNGQVTKPVVDAAHGIIKSRRKGNEAQALGEDAFIKESIMDNPAVPDGERLGLARKANKARQSQVHMGYAGTHIDKMILDSVGDVSRPMLSHQDAKDAHGQAGSLGAMRKDAMEQERGGWGTGSGSAHEGAMPDAAGLQTPLRVSRTQDRSHGALAQERQVSPFMQGGGYARAQGARTMNLADPLAIARPVAGPEPTGAEGGQDMSTALGEAVRSSLLRPFNEPLPPVASVPEGLVAAVQEVLPEGQAVDLELLARTYQMFQLPGSEMGLDGLSESEAYEAFVGFALHVHETSRELGERIVEGSRMYLYSTKWLKMNHSIMQQVTSKQRSRNAISLYMTC